jgi:hypothetical protein
MATLMKTADVIDYLDFKVCKSTLSQIIKKSCKRVTINEIEFFDKRDIETFMTPDLYREMAVEVISFLITEK